MCVKKDKLIIVVWWKGKKFMNNISHELQLEVSDKEQLVGRGRGIVWDKRGVQ